MAYEHMSLDDLAKEIGKKNRELERLGHDAPGTALMGYEIGKMLIEARCRVEGIDEQECLRRFQEEDD